MLHAISVLALIGAIGILLTRQAAISVWAISLALFNGLVMKYGSPSLTELFILWGIEVIFIFGSLKPLRR